MVWMLDDDSKYRYELQKKKREAQKKAAGWLSSENFS